MSVLPALGLLVFTAAPAHAEAVIAGPVAVGDEPAGLAVHGTTGWVYVANEADNSVSVLAPLVVGGAADGVVTTIPVAGNPSAIAINTATNRAYVATRSGNVVCIDTTTNAVVGTPIAIGVDATAVAVNPSTNRVYVTHASGGGLSVIDGVTRIVIATPLLGLGTIPSGVAVDPVANRVYVADSNALVHAVIDGVTNATVPGGVDLGAVVSAVAVNPIRGRVYCADFFNSRVSVVDAATRTVIAQVAVANPHALVVNLAIDRLYVASPTAPGIFAVDGASHVVLGEEVDVGSPRPNSPSTRGTIGSTPRAGVPIECRPSACRSRPRRSSSRRVPARG